MSCNSHIITKDMYYWVEGNGQSWNVATVLKNVFTNLVSQINECWSIGNKGEYPRNQRKRDTRKGAVGCHGVQ